MAGTQIPSTLGRRPLYRGDENPEGIRPLSRGEVPPRQRGCVRWDEASKETVRKPGLEKPHPLTPSKGTKCYPLTPSMGSVERSCQELPHLVIFSTAEIMGIFVSLDTLYMESMSF